MPDFVDSILPWNYWITKSMEFSKVQTSWTLWYLKKWMVYYNYIIMNPEIYDNIYEEIIEIFDDFIESLPTELQAAATNFFYDVDIRDEEEFMKFSYFSHHQTLPTANDEKIFYISCKKYYFMYLMNTWWQQNYKLKIKNYLSEKKRYEEVINLITHDMEEDGKNGDFIRWQISDFHAAIRNERQIFFYYWFIYGNENESVWFNRPTFIWEMTVFANFDELLLIWEHQKMKMISQSPVTEIWNLWTWYWNLPLDKFWISYHPYCLFLNFIRQEWSITYDEYKYILSRSKNNNIQLFNTIRNIGELKAKIESFWRDRDEKDEDFSKELKKYLLWLLNLKKDGWKNYFACLKYDDQEVSVSNTENLNFYARALNILAEYLDYEYSEKYYEFENFLKRKYKSQIIEEEQITRWEYLNSRYDWLRYIITFDKVLLSHLIYLWISIKNEILDFSISNDVFGNEFTKYSHLAKVCDIRNRSDFIRTMKSIQSSLERWRCFIAEIDEENPRTYGNLLEQIISEDTLLALSEHNWDFQMAIEQREERSSRLRAWMQKYYIANFSEQDWNIKCDCCWSKTFKKNDDIPYLEFHHVIPFKQDNWPDHYLNLVWICPNCHRKFHYIKNSEKTGLYWMLSENNHLHKNLEVRLNELYQLNVLRPWHLDFLLKESAISDEVYDRFMSLA